MEGTPDPRRHAPDAGGERHGARVRSASRVDRFIALCKDRAGKRPRGEPVPREALETVVLWHKHRGIPAREASASTIWHAMQDHPEVERMCPGGCASLHLAITGRPPPSLSPEEEEAVRDLYAKRARRALPDGPRPSSERIPAQLACLACERGDIPPKPNPPSRSGGHPGVNRDNVEAVWRQICSDLGWEFVDLPCALG